MNRNFAKLAALFILAGVTKALFATQRPIINQYIDNTDKADKADVEIKDPGVEIKLEGDN